MLDSKKKLRQTARKQIYKQRMKRTQTPLSDGYQRLTSDSNAVHTRDFPIHAITITLDPKQST